LYSAHRHHRYVREKRGRRLQESIEKSEALAQDIADLSKDVETTQKFVNDLNREIAAGGSTVSNLRENLRIRRLQADIEAIQAEIETYDLDAAAQAKKNFEERYTSLKEKENRLHAEVCSLDRCQDRV
jgi:DNA repair protein RAD50